MNRDEVMWIVESARKKGGTPDLPCETLIYKS